MKDGKKLAFLLMSADIIHPGHLNIIHEALKLDATIMVGLYSDEAIASYKRVPFMNFEQRKTVLENIKGVDIVIEQKTRDVTETLLKYKPDYFVHGTDWRNGALAKERQKILDTISAWGGQLVEPEYTAGICSSNAHAILKERGTTPEARQEKFFKLVDVKKKLRACTVYDCITTSIVESAAVKPVGKAMAEFDAFWLDNNYIAQVKGKPSTSLIDFSECHVLLNEISDISVKPFIFNYGQIFVTDQFISAVRCLEKIGVSVIAVEKDESSTMEQLRRQIQKAELNLMGEGLKFAIKLSAAEISEKLIQEYSDIHINAFVLEGTVDQIAAASRMIKKQLSFATVMAVVTAEENHNELSLYEDQVNVLIYRDEMMASIRDSIAKQCMQILE